MSIRWRLVGMSVSDLSTESILDTEKSWNASLNATIDSYDDGVSSSSSLRTDEKVIVVLVLLLWAAAIALFINRWGKIRQMEPYQPYFEPAVTDAAPVEALIQHRTSVFDARPSLTLVLPQSSPDLDRRASNLSANRLAPLNPARRRASYFVSAVDTFRRGSLMLPGSLLPPTPIAMESQLLQSRSHSRRTSLCTTAAELMMRTSRSNSLNLVHSPIAETGSSTKDKSRSSSKGSIRSPLTSPSGLPRLSYTRCSPEKDVEQVLTATTTTVAVEVQNASLTHQNEHRPRAAVLSSSKSLDHDYFDEENARVRSSRSPKLPRLISLSRKLSVTHEEDDDNDNNNNINVNNVKDDSHITSCSQVQSDV